MKKRQPSAHKQLELFDATGLPPGNDIRLSAMHGQYGVTAQAVCGDCAYFQRPASRRGGGCQRAADGWRWGARWQACGYYVSIYV